MRRMMTWLATAAALTFALPGAANQNDPRLDGLFQRLKAATGADEARAVEQSIWRIWLASGDETIDRFMAAGIQAMSTRDHEVALKAFDLIVRSAPGFAEGWNKRATVHYLMGNYESSIADIERTLALEPRHFGALSGLGLVNLALERDEAALDAFDAALEIYPLLPGADTRIRELRERVRGRGI